MILVVADDLDARSFEHLPAVTRLLRERGARFSRFYVTTPICCPARASIFSGQYAHNHGVRRNNGEQGGFHAFHLGERERSTVASWLREAGYHTALVGKYLNGYPRLPRRFADARLPRDYVPPGWDEWYAQMDRGATGGPEFELNENGTIVAYNDRPEHYTTDVLARHAVSVIERADETPFFLYVAPLVPHYPAPFAPRHASAFADVRAPRPPSFDEPDVSDKPAHIREAARLSEVQISTVDQHHGDRLRSLLSLDELVTALVEALRGAGKLDNTYMFVTSDHGWHLGEHRLPFGKETPYEESIRAPLGIIGPGLRGDVISALALNIDLAPTIAEIAGARVPDAVDGRSLLPLLGAPQPEEWRRAFLVEHTSAGKTRSYPALGEMPSVPSYRALRASLLADDLLYVEYETGERELYDIRADPHQLVNSAGDLEPEGVTAMAAKIEALRRCVGAECRAAEDGALEPPVIAETTPA